MSKSYLEIGLDDRKEKINNAKDYLTRTKDLFDKFGSEELKTTVAKFKELNNSLNSSEVKLVVIGEFSRGKSSLVNALLNINLLPTNLSPTTAINTFIRALPDGQTNKIIRIHYIDPNKQPKDIPWNDDSDLKKWGTELDKDNAEKRKDIDKIELFIDNELLKKGLILVDTPGLGSINTHHDRITQKAIAESHIAIFVQSTDQLGGTDKEWDFVKKEVSANFEKFITVINCWDAVLEPNDSIDKKKTEKERVEEKLNYVRENFKSYLGDNAKVHKLTDDKHLIPVSALWATDDDIIKQKRSGIDKLSSRIVELFSTGEALEQIYSKPLKQLINIQKKLQKHIQNELGLLDNNKSEAEQKREIDLLDQKIKNLENASKNAILESSGEHSRCVDSIEREFERDVVTPLNDLKNDIEIRIDESYVRSLILSNSKKIGLPTELDEQFQNISEEISNTLKSKQNLIKEMLEGLRKSYANKMEKFANDIQNGMSSLNIEIPKLDVNLDIDFVALEEYQKEKMQLQEELDAKQDEVDELERKKGEAGFDESRLKRAREDLSRVEIKVERLGSRPSAIIYQRTKQIPDPDQWSISKFFFGTRYISQPYEEFDTSDREAWDREKQILDDIIANKEAAVDALITEQQKSHQIQMSYQAALRKVELDIKRKQKKLDELAAKQNQYIDNSVREITQKLRRNTAGQLDKKIKYFRINVLDSVRTIFSDHMDHLEQCVNEQYLETLNAKRQQRKEVLEKMNQGKEEIVRRKVELLQGQEYISELLRLTENALNSVGL